MTTLHHLSPLLAALSLLLAGCAATPPAAVPARVAQTPQLPAEWLSPRPHAGSPTQLAQWWQQFNDPLLLQLIKGAQTNSPTLKAALARLAQARAQAQQAQAGLLPSLGGSAQASRGRQQPGTPVANSAQAALGLSWEIDLFGAQRAEALAQDAERRASEAQWHEARVSLAADVAAAYLQLRHAQAQLHVAQRDLKAAEQVADWGAQQLRAGLFSASEAALLDTQRAVSATLRDDQLAQVGIQLQQLALLTAQPAEALMAQLSPPDWGPLPTLPEVPAFAVDRLPVATLAQRPDLAASHQQWLAAAYSEQGVRANAYPQLSLGALLGQARFEVGGASTRGSVFSIAPSLSLPLFDAGLRAAQREAAGARTAQAAAAFETRWRTAVSEVEEALLRLNAATTRRQEADNALRQWLRIAADAQKLAAAGLQSGPQRVAAERNAYTAYSTLLAVHHEQAQAWVRLYRSLGGGWTEAKNS